ncbi:paraquat-inducible protein A [Cocleimonas sp. KMM 6895]|nr:paraquat-inducible protein A [Cocleimonas sp. KMM 6892]MEC4714688.1 paraquat-inducible protein A [Cocleimonas sp. KMM 6895]MEC4744498.1 paraquat-inducible protein A [Cocleimonas sp. KMM 6896]
MKSIIRNFPRQGIIINLLLMAALTCLVVGVSAPLLTLEKMYFFENTVSLLSTIKGLYLQQEWFLFYVIAIFSLCIPAIKIASLVLITNMQFEKGSFLDKTLQIIETFGKWSMLDVFVVALLLVSVKLGVLAKVDVHYGLYVFASSVLLTMGISFWIHKLSK